MRSGCGDKGKLLEVISDMQKTKTKEKRIPYRGFGSAADRESEREKPATAASR